MGNVINQSTAETMRIRLQLLRSFHHAAVRSGDESLRAAMLEYRQSAFTEGERGAA